MIERTKQIRPASAPLGTGNQRSYAEIVDYLDRNWAAEHKERDLATMQRLATALGNPEQGLDILMVGGTNGKSLTLHFATKLLRQEGVKVGAFYSPHTLTYNERFVIADEAISNKLFTELANEVINVAQTHDVKADTLELLSMMAFLLFKKEGVEIVLLEATERTTVDPLYICKPKVVGISRLTDDHDVNLAPEHMINCLLSPVSTGVHVVSADQSKQNLHTIQQIAEQKGATWAMPIRKLAQFPYPYEQLHGRCGALAERMCQLYFDHNVRKDSIVISGSLLVKQRGQRGRPTLEAKRQAELNPRRTLGEFWQDTTASSPGHFQLLEKEKPTILLDNAANTDAFKNLLLGVRLMHYQRPLKGLTFIIGCDKNQMNIEEFLRLLRYFSKKNSGQIIFCPIVNTIPGIYEESWDVEQITNAVKSLKIKARSCESFELAFEQAVKTVDERQGMVVISGSHSIVAQYWKHRGVKKLS